MNYRKLNCHKFSNKNAICKCNYLYYTKIRRTQIAISDNIICKGAGSMNLK